MFENPPKPSAIAACAMSVREQRTSSESYMGVFFGGDSTLTRRLEKVSPHGSFTASPKDAMLYTKGI